MFRTRGSGVFRSSSFANDTGGRRTGVLSSAQRQEEENALKAAVFHGPHQPLTIETVDIDQPLAHEVLVRTVATGVCHSDLHFVDGLYPMPAPAILGHE